jgi:hypothetical protein
MNSSCITFSFLPQYRLCWRLIRWGAQERDPWVVILENQTDHDGPGESLLQVGRYIIQPLCTPTPSRNFDPVTGECYLEPTFAEPLLNLITQEILWWF